MEGLTADFDGGTIAGAAFTTVESDDVAALGWVVAEPEIAGWLIWSVASGVVEVLGLVTAGAVATGDPDAFGVGMTGVSTGLSGTDGSRWARMSAARADVAFATGASCSSRLVITSTSSKWLKTAAGFIVTWRNSLPFEVFETVPSGSPLGKI